MAGSCRIAHPAETMKKANLIDSQEGTAQVGTGLKRKRSFSLHFELFNNSPATRRGFRREVCALAQSQAVPPLPGRPPGLARARSGARSLSGEVACSSEGLGLPLDWTDERTPRWIRRRELRGLSRPVSSATPSGLARGQERPSVRVIRGFARIHSRSLSMAVASSEARCLQKFSTCEEKPDVPSETFFVFFFSSSQTFSDSERIQVVWDFPCVSRRKEDIRGK